MTWTIQKLISWSTEYLKDRGVEKPRLDVELLLAPILRKDRLGLYTHFDQPLQEQELQTFKALLKRRALREPLAYILGEKEFYSLKFKVTQETLIPRPETEQLVELGVEFLLKTFSEKPPTPSSPIKILDLATGSGCVLIALLFNLISSGRGRPMGLPQKGKGGHTGPSLLETSNDLEKNKNQKNFRNIMQDLVAEGLGVDFNENTLQVARENAERHGLSPQTRWLKHDLSQTWPKELEGPFALITANLPYVSAVEHQTLQPEVRDFEPKAALVPGPSGLEAFHWVLPQLASRLIPGGLALLEIGADQGQALRELAQKLCPELHCEILKDLSGRERVVCLSL